MCVDTQKLATRLKASIVSVFPSGSVRMNKATPVLGLLQDSFLGRCIVQVYSVTLFVLWPLTQQPLGWTS